ncbi:TOMM precursor leader peptide-binding protein [Halostreptopolyspora alba]|uniref:YcaO domain-containing protein n=1 Tax=Halostreptopolyspora alba TaxID=2487137 RepID=A0A3N0E8L3_9ACTN|nr:hypothetical protein EFW17_13235 [Nocardiopsaceae bacterium YIM 96095]
MTSEPTPRVLVAGRGLVATAVLETLAAAGESADSRETPQDLDVGGYRAIVWAADHEGDDVERVRWRAAAHRVGAVWLPVLVESGGANVGPASVAARAGCDGCAALRRGAAEHGPERERVRERWGSRATQAPSPLITGVTAATVAHTVAAELARTEAERASGASERLVEWSRVRLTDLATTRHRLLPSPWCRYCGGRSPDTAGEAFLRPADQRKSSPHSLRTRRLTPRRDELLETYVDRETGVLRKMEKVVSGVFPSMAAPLALTSVTERGYGRALDYRSCTVTAVTEALERLGGMFPGGRATTVRGSRRELGDDAIDPRRLGSHPAAHHNRPGFPYPRYDDDLRLDWVWATSLTFGRPILVPETYAYYFTSGYEGGGNGFVYEVSNGCALGASLEEAALHGLLELAERDAFLLTWYARLAAPALALDSATDPLLPLMVERLERATGRRLRVFDTTTEHGVPSVWAMAVHPDDDLRTPKALCAAGADLDPQRAIAEALVELASMVPWQNETYPRRLADAQRMLVDPYEVRTMGDHAILYSHPEAFERFSFLPDSGDSWAIADRFQGRPHTAGENLREDLDTMVGRYADHGQEVIVVDQTTPEHRAGGFSCAKVIVPGLLPMTFGHEMRRVDGLSRLLEVPRLLGHRATALDPGEINPHPHPFS